MKLLSIVVPSYNSQDYMENCIKSLLVGGDLVEILVVNDGSKDRTAEIADQYQQMYPGIVRAIHQENKGHGGAVNTGLAYATGAYIKVVDSDDWVDEVAYCKVLQTLERLYESNAKLDMLICNYVYEKVGAKRKKVMQYDDMLPKGEIFGWSEVKSKLGHYILMHSVIYRTQLLCDCHFQLPEHTFYVDNLFVYLPLPYVERMYYLDVDFYRYFIGREDQSVNEKVMISRIDQQIRVNKLMVDAYDLAEIKNKSLQTYMLSYLDVISAVTSSLLVRSGTAENYQKKLEVWNYIKQSKPNNYKLLCGRAMGFTINLPKPISVFMIRLVYFITYKVFGFN